MILEYKWKNSFEKERFGEKSSLWLIFTFFGKERKQSIVVVDFF